MLKGSSLSCGDSVTLRLYLFWGPCHLKLPATPRRECQSSGGIDALLESPTFVLLEEFNNVTTSTFKQAGKGSPVMFLDSLFCYHRRGKKWNLVDNSWYLPQPSLKCLINSNKKGTRSLLTFSFWYYWNN